MLIGKKFGRLNAIEKIKVKHRTYYKCICDCGNEVVVGHSNLQTGNTKSCGCLQKEKSLESNYKHGHTINYRKTKEYKAWVGIRTRCYDINCNRYDRYGGRGITVCERWLESFENFLADVGLAPSSEHSIDRINNDGNYEPGNVKWSTSYEQVNNRTSL